MANIDINKIQVNSMITTSLYDSNGRLLLAKGAKYTEAYQQILLRSGIKTLTTSPGLTQLESNSRTRLLPITEVRLGTKLSSDLYHENGTRLFPKGIIIEPRHLEYFQKNNIQSVMIRNETNEVLDLHQSHKVEEELNSFDQQVESNRSLFNDQPSGAPFSDQLKKQNSPAPFLKEEVEKKEAELKQQVLQTQDMYSCLQRGRTFPKTLVENIVNSFLNDVTSNQPLLLSLLSKQTDDMEYLYRHSLNTALASMNIGINLGYSEGQIFDLVSAALFSDVGMLQIPRWVLDQKRKLTPKEYSEVQNHVIYSVNLLDHIQGVSDQVKHIVYQSHEMGNGTGYPKRRKDRVINNFSKIIRMADCYDSLTSPRPHREALLPYHAVETIIQMCSKGSFDPKTMRSFLNTFSLFPIGSFLRIYDYSIAQVISTHPTQIDRPTVQVLFDQHNTPITPPKIIDLSTVSSANPKVIIDVIKPEEIIKI